MSEDRRLGLRRLPAEVEMQSGDEILPAWIDVCECH
jgi:hypothetical protein